MPPKPKRKSQRVTAVQTETPTYSAVRFSMATLVFTAMIGSAVIFASLIIRLVPTRESGIVPGTARVSRSADSSVLGELLVQFKPNTTELTRLQAVTTALQKPVNVTTLTTVKKRSGLRTVTQTVESVSQRLATVRSLQPAIATTVKLTDLNAPVRAKRGEPTAVAATAALVNQWYVLKVDPPTADLTQIARALRQQSLVVHVEANRRVQVAATRSLASTTAGAAVKLADAQKAAQTLAGDVNVDGRVDGKDVRLLINYLTTTGTQPKSTAGADVNLDGSIDIADLSALVRMLSTNYRIPATDLTGDGTVNWDEVNFLVRYLYNRGPAPSPLAAADYDADGNVDLSDLSWLIDKLTQDPANGQLAYGSGDANGDGVVDNQDLEFLIAYLSNRGPAPSPLGRADMDVDGTVDLTDLVFLITLLTEGDAGTVNAAALGTSATGTPTASADGGYVEPTLLPTFLLGDSNADGRVTTSDLHYFIAYLYTSGPAPSPLGRADLDLDGNLDISDLTRLISMVYASIESRVLKADLNADGAVSHADVTYLIAYLYGQGPAPDLTKADVDGDGRVDISDLSILGQYVWDIEDPKSCSDIRTVGTTTFLNGDVNASGTVTDADLTALANIVYARALVPTPKDRADVDCDGTLTPMDIYVLDAKVHATPVQTVLPGDANSDGAVDTKDIGASISTPTDVNLDGVRDVRDTYALVTLLKANRIARALPDANGDGKVTWADADVVVGLLTPGSPALPATLDVTADGTVDAADAIAYVSALRRQSSNTQFLVGDANADELVDCRDVQFLHRTYLKSGPKPSPELRADVSGDGVANIADALLLAKRACPGTDGGAKAGDITVALLDSGVAAKQAEVKPVLAAARERATNKVDDDRNGYVDDLVGYTTYGSGTPATDCNGHGTALATLIAGRTGVATRAKVVPVKVVDCKGTGTVLSVAQGLIYATKRSADVSVLPVSGVGVSKFLANVVAYNRAAGMFVIVAAGNDGASVSRVLPANVDGVLSVGATVASGKSLTAYSNIGAKVLAPGSATGVSFDGTSVSTTYVAGTAALLLSKTPTLTVKQLEAKLVPPTSRTNPKALKLLDAASALTR